MLLVFEETNHHVGSDRNEDGIDKKEVERPDKVLELERGQSEPGRTERRHQGRCDRNARDDRRGTVLARLGYDPGQTAEQRDQYVVRSRHRAGQQFALRITQR